MPFTVVRDRDPSQQLRQRMMIYEMMRRGTGTPNMDKLLEDREEQRRWEANQARLERGTEADIVEGQERIRLGQGALDLSAWEKGQQGMRAERETEAEVTYKGAATRREQSHANLYDVEAQGEREENAREVDATMVDRANRRRSWALNEAINGRPLDAKGTKVLEDAERLLSGNDQHTLPRNPDGSWQVDRKTLATTLLDEKGMPRTEFAEGLRKLEEPYSEVGQLFADAAEASEKGADPTTQARYNAAVWAKLEPALSNDVDRSTVRKMLEDGNFEGAEFTATKSRSPKPQKIKIPDTSERVDQRDTENLLNDLNRIDMKFEALTKSGRIPVGYFRQPLFKLRQKLGNDDPEISTFLKDADMFVSRYIYLVTGKQTNEDERADLARQVFNRYDSPQTFRLGIKDFREKLQERMALTNGIAVGYGMQPVEGAPILDPIDVIKRGGRLPPFIQQKGYIPSEDVEEHFRGMANMGRRMQRQKSRIGGEEEFRQNETNGMSTEGLAGFSEADLIAERQRLEDELAEGQ